MEHEISEVTSGYRLVLTYNLINTIPTNPANAPTGLAEKMKELEEALLFWKHNYNGNASDCPAVLAYILRHWYTRETLSYSRLKGGDRVTGLCLSELCKKHGFVFYLATLEHEFGSETESEHTVPIRRGRELSLFDDMEPIAKVYWESLELESIVELDGAKLLDKVPFNDSQIVQDDLFAGPKGEHFSGPTGSIRNPFADDSDEERATQYYYRTVSPNS